MSHTTLPSPHARPAQNRRRSRPAADASTYLVPPAMLIVAIAMGIASHLHLGIGADMAIAVTAALFCAMLLSHVLLRAADLADRAEEEAEGRRMAQVSSPMPTIPEPGRAELHPAPDQPVAPAARKVMSFEEHVAAAEFGRGLGSLAAQDVTSVAATAPVASAGPELAQPAPVPPGWTMRPADVVFAPDPEPAAAVPVPADVAAAIGTLRPTLAEHALPRGGVAEADRIDRILRRLAHDIKSGAAPDTAAVPEPEAPSDAPSDTQSDAALADAVDALRSTVEAMKVAVQVPQDAAAPVAFEQPAPVANVPATPVEVRIAAVAEALAAERVDVVLAPILGLANSEAEHFEVSVRLRGEDDRVLEPRADAPGAGLLPLLDAIGVRHATGFALKLDRRGRAGSVFSQIAAESLQSTRFVGDVAERYAQGVSDRLVLSFAPGDVRALGGGHFEVLDELCRLGFRYAIANVADLDMDFEVLRAHGFQFVKLDASVFLNGLPYGDAVVPASDLCRYFSELGFAVIVSGIDDDAARSTLMACGVTLGQGQIYGEPRAIPHAPSVAAA